jgi:hypothetical protein
LRLRIFLSTLFLLSGCSRWESISIQPIDINVTQPSLISILFKIDREKSEILDENRFLIYEDGEIIDEKESFKKVINGGSQKSELNIQRDIVISIFLDSQFNREKRAEVVESLKRIFERGYIILNEKTRVMLVVISDKIDLIQNFTSDYNEIERGLNRILNYNGFSKNGNLYENIARFGNLINSNNENELYQKYLVLITESGDRASTLSLRDLLKLIDEERIHIVGVGRGLSRDSLREIGRGSSLFIESFAEFEKAITSTTSNIQKDMKNIYLLQYLSPKRESKSGDSEHLLTLRLFENGNIGDDSKLEAKFNSRNFTDIKPEIILDIKGEIKSGERAIFRASTKWTHNNPEYEWFILDRDLANLSISENSEEAILQCSRDKLGKTELLIRDKINGVDLYYPISLGLYEDINFDFESGIIPKDFKIIGSGWEIYLDERGRSLKNSLVKDGEETSLTLSGYFDAKKMAFDYRIASEEGCDEMVFLIDGKGFYQSGLVNWSRVEFPISKGEHTFEWKYRKDSSKSKYSDSVWIDNITFE